MEDDNMDIDSNPSGGDLEPNLADERPPEPPDIEIPVARISSSHIITLYRQLLYMHGFIPQYVPTSNRTRETAAIADNFGSSSCLKLFQSQTV
jgi:hypothetical protein